MQILFEYKDTDFHIGSGSYTAHWLVRAYNGSYSGPTNSVSTDVLYYKISTNKSDHLEKTNMGVLHNAPNPFNPVTTISFDLKEAAFVQLDIFDIRGSKTTSLINNNIEKGNYSVDFDGTDLPSGIYVYRLTSVEKKSGKTWSDAKRMLLIK
jgi:Secretion system C-terminal sorting domain